MKKQVSKITLKTDKIVSLSKIQAQQVAGGARPTASNCTTKICSI
ncbi:class I lanthipeptide [Larkinella terrae]|nr:class I lanthipeptide [Larkinella terrae]